MKSPVSSKVAIPFVLLTGVALWAGYAKRFDAEGKLAYEPNVACLKGSPYGKILALAMQGEIDFYWHRGSTHEHAEVLNEEHHHHGDGHHHHGDGHHHHHGHGGHSHQHDFQVGDVDVAEHGDCCDCGSNENASKNVSAAETQQKSLRQRAKEAIKMMAATAHRRTDNKPLTPAHAKYLQESIEDKLRLAYELDPSNYTNYGNYHLFIASTTFGKNVADDDEAVAIARKTLDFCKKDDIDPASWVTAASAAYNIIYHIGRYHDQFTVTEAKASLAEFDFCVQKYNELLDRAIAEGRIVSEERYREMLERIRYLGKLREAQGAYMKRMMTSKMTTQASYPTIKSSNTQ